jgi:CheY-like chemotaxis protein
MGLQRVHGSAEAALEAIGQDTPDVYIVDINLPGISGLEFITKARERLPRAQSWCIRYTTMMTRSSRRSGGNGYLLKSTDHPVWIGWAAGTATPRPSPVKYGPPCLPSAGPPAISPRLGDAGLLGGGQPIAGLLRHALMDKGSEHCQCQHEAMYGSAHGTNLDPLHHAVHHWDHPPLRSPFGHRLVHHERMKSVGVVRPEEV